MRSGFSFFLLILLVSIAASSFCAGQSSSMHLDLTAPIDRWDEAIPLGNGLSGGLLWGEGNEIRLSLDRGDLWDERLPEIYEQANWNYATIQKLKAKGNQKEISRLFDHPYNQIPYPTKLPVGRLVLTLDPLQQVKAFRLDMRRAVGQADLGEERVEVFFSAVDPVALIRVPGPGLSHQFLRPDGLDRLCYAPAEFGRTESLSWMKQKAALGLEYAVVVAHKRVEGATLLAVAIATNEDGENPLAFGKRYAESALESGYEKMLAPHLTWWSDFWTTSSVTIPDERIQRHYNLVKYFYGAASRPDAPPMPLQGLWTRDDGGLPPWKGDYHHDLNTQTTYLAYPTAGLFDAGLSFINYNWDLLPVYRAFAESFFGVDGAAMPGVATLGGRPTAGWAQYALSPTQGLWVGQSFYLHWRYTMDHDFLAQRAYPWLNEIARGVVNLLEMRGGRLYLPLSSSPEIHDNSINAWLKPNSNYDLALMQWAFEALEEMAKALGREPDTSFWRGQRARLDDLLVDEEKVLMFASGEPFNASHRHHSHAMAIHPLGMLNIEGSERDREIVNATLDRMHALGTEWWTGYSFSWFSCMLARAGRREQALKYLEDYERAFILRNGFHANGDQTRSGLSRFQYRPFTLEGNFLAIEAVHEMLLQSWGGRVRVFPAVSDRWQDVSFNDLCAQGGFRVSAKRSAGSTLSVDIVATVDQTLRLKNPFEDKPYRCTRPVQSVGDEIRCDLKAGDTLELVREAPVKENRISLAGPWSFKLDPDHVGEKEGWFNLDLPETIDLPGTTDLAVKGFALDRETMSYSVEFECSRFPAAISSERADEWGFLVRDHYYLGKAWYQKTVTIPQSWADKPVRLHLERVLWMSSVWIDDRWIGDFDSLVAPHEYMLGRLEPGPHRITLCIDNRMAHNISTIGHAYGPETQSRWNGVVGVMELCAVAPAHITRVQAFPAADRKSVKVKVAMENLFAANTSGALDLQIHDELGNNDFGSCTVGVELSPGVQIKEFNVIVEKPVQPWDEFSTKRYILAATLRPVAGGEHSVETRFGFRHIERDGKMILVNGRRVFLRGTLDCCVYPKTGHPPVTVEAWLEKLGIIKAYGFNHVRFHTWCPPEAAFEAADRLGLYLAPETPFWVDDWTTGTWKTPASLGRDRESTSYVRNEIRRISDAYGNHPSFAFFCIGNEFGNSGTDWQHVNGLLDEAKRNDSRRLYNATAARKRMSADDFWVTHHTGEVGARGVGPAHTNWDFSAATDSTDLPLIAHETGQRPVFPDYEAMLPKFTGPLKPYNYERLYNRFKSEGLGARMQDFHEASARFQNIQYKAEHEAMLRTPDLAGYQLLMLNDFTGQCEALVGLLDPFWESKGVVTCEQVRQWNAPTVLLARFDRFVWTSDQTFEAAIDVAHYGERDLIDARIKWVVVTEFGSTVAEGELDPCFVKTGGLSRIGRVSVPLASVQTASALKLRVTLGETENTWPLWSYPAQAGDAHESDVMIVCGYDEEVQQALDRGRRVLMLAHGLHSPHVKRTGFLSVYWSAGWWGDRFSSLGIFCDPRHPALSGFPNAGHSEWQWFSLNEGAITFDLTEVANGLRPIVQPVTDFHHNRLLAHLFEARVGEGRLLVCGYDLQKDLGQRHAARQMRASLLSYMNSDAFEPGFTLTRAQVETLLRASLMQWLGAEAEADNQAKGAEASKAIDGDPSTIWHTSWAPVADPLPHELKIRFKSPVELKGITYPPRQDMSNGRIARYEIYGSNDGREWGVPLAAGVWENGDDEKTVVFETPVSCQYLKMVALSEVLGQPFTSCAEFDVIVVE